MATTLSPSIFFVQVTLCVLTHHVPTPPKNEVSILNPPAVSINCAHPGAHHETSPTHHGLKTAPPVEAYKEDRAMEFLRGHGGTAMATTLSPSIFFVQPLAKSPQNGDGAERTEKREEGGGGGGVLPLFAYKLNRKQEDIKARFREDRRPANTGGNPRSSTTGVLDCLRHPGFGRIFCILGRLGALARRPCVAC
ncbi:uncharacterized protein ISCGN_027429 [Ixodes scapularis]